MTNLYPELSREPAILGNPAWLAEYVAMRERGEPHGFAAMLVMQQPPACQTDATFFEGRGTLSDQLGKAVNHYTHIAEQHGYRPGARDVYEPGLARFQGDPEAFIPAVGGKGHVKRVLEKRGYRVKRSDSASHGLGVEAIQQPPPKAKRMGNDLIRDNAQKMIQQDPSLAKLSKRDLKEAVIEKHGPKA